MPIKVYEKTFGGLLNTEKPEIPVSAAIVRSIDHAAYDDGQVERLQSKLEKQSQIIGLLVSILITKELMTADQLDECLSYHFGASE